MITLIVTIAVLGLIAYCATLLPIPAPFGQIINVILVIITVVYLIRFLGVHI